MALDKVIDSAALDLSFTRIAQAIREKNGEQTQYTPEGMPQAIRDLPTGDGTAVLIGQLTRGSTVIETGMSSIQFLCLRSTASASSTHQGCKVAIVDFVNNKRLILGRTFSGSTPETVETSATTGLTVSGGKVTWSASSENQKLNANVTYVYAVAGTA